MLAYRTPAKYTVLAKDESKPVPLVERITPSADIRLKYARLGNNREHQERTRSLIARANRKVETYPLTLLERMALDQKAEIEREVAEEVREGGTEGR